MLTKQQKMSIEYEYLLYAVLGKSELLQDMEKVLGVVGEQKFKEYLINTYRA